MMALQLTGNDRHGSPLLSLNSGVSNTFSWSPFGNSAPRNGPSTTLLGFNGERADPLSGVTHLGNGYRAYSPALRRFTCPDSESPFGIGGINSYVYCDSDPVNRTDPSGHGPIIWLLRKVIRLGARLGIKAAQSEAMTSAFVTIGYVETGLEVASWAATGTASKVKEMKGQPEIAHKLSWASLGLGITGGFGLAEIEVQRVLRGARGLSERLARAKGGSFFFRKKGMAIITDIGKEEATKSLSSYLSYAFKGLAATSLITGTASEILSESNPEASDVLAYFSLGAAGVSLFGEFGLQIDSHLRLKGHGTGDALTELEEMERAKKNTGVVDKTIDYAKDLLNVSSLATSVASEVTQKDTSATLEKASIATDWAGKGFDLTQLIRKKKYRKFIARPFLPFSE
ncbi:RHS repeat-associated core domain-containing protein [Xenorhabdus entomophaga]|uniref:RHS repeat-associated core domain-containing protein n=1 Tax=Xenorhabdus entomophaga TaxID=3136257 RepID=UPI0030F37A02